jgi:type VI secretion system secreted protein VgrG
VGTATHKLNVGGNGKLEIYDYPGEYAQRFDGVDKNGRDRPNDPVEIFNDNKRTVGVRMQEEALPSLLIHGSGTCRQMTSGYKFTLDRHFNADGPYVLVSVEHKARNPIRGAEAEFTYYNNFTAIPFALPYRPLRTSPKPFVQGSQTAVVVGDPGEEIHTDKFGRVKVQFFWDRQGKWNSDSSCWIRVAQPWAGKRWGAFFNPRIGQEVIVDFLEGDPDQPIITGSVYNADQMHPYLGQGPDPKHPEDNKLTGVKSNSTLGGAGFNEWRFDDTKGKEQIFMHAERNMDVRVKHDSLERVIHDRHLIVGWEKDGNKGGDQYEMVYQDKHLNIQRDHIEHIEGNMLLMVGHGDAKDPKGNVDIVIESDKKELIEKNDHLHIKGAQNILVDGKQDIIIKCDKKELNKADSHLHVTNDRNEKIDGTQSLTVGKNQQEKVGQNHALDAGQEIHLKGGMKVIIEAGQQLSLKGPGGFVDIGPDGVTIQGTKVLINSGGSAGSGSGSSPTAPQDAKEATDAEQAKPIKPKLADDAKSGQKSAAQYG